MRELATLASKYDDTTGEDGIEKLLTEAALASDQDSLMHTQKSEEENRLGFREMDIVREGYDRNISNSTASLLISNWISFPVILLTIIIRRARLISVQIRSSN